MKKYKIYLISLILLVIASVVLCFIPIGVSKFAPDMETQIEKELGVKVHIEKLVLRLGPLIKIKAPKMYLMYEDGQKFAQFDDIKFYITWSSLFKKTLNPKMINAKNCIIKTNANNVYMNKLLNKVSEKDVGTTPLIVLKQYSLELYDKSSNDNYLFKGNNFTISKVSGYKNLKTALRGEFEINNQKYISYDLSVTPNYDNENVIKQFDYSKIISKLKQMDFYSDVIVDLKLYKNKNDKILSSGFINIDNVSVFDKTKKMPKSFIYLTLWGDKASIVSNIYTDINKKIYIDGVVNTSNKPVIDLKVKTDEINLNDLYNKFQILFDFSPNYDIQNIDGKLRADFFLKGDINKIKSNGYLHISEGVLNAKGIDISDISSDINFNNNSVEIANAKGYVKNSLISASGSIDKNSIINVKLLMDKVNISYLLPKKYGVNGGFANVVMNLYGKINEIRHKEKVEISNVSIKQKDYGLKIGLIKADTTKDNCITINNLLFDNNYTEIVKVPSLKAFIEKNNILVKNTNVFMPNSKLKLSGFLKNYNFDNLEYHIMSDGSVSARDIKCISLPLASYPVTIGVSGNRTNSNINTNVSIQHSYLFNEPMILNLTALYNKNILKIEDLSLSAMNGKSASTKKVVLNGVIDNLKKPVLKNVRVYIPQLLNVNIDNNYAQIKGDLFLNGNYLKPEMAGQLSIQNFINQQFMFSMQNCILDFNKHDIMVNAPQVKIADSTLNVSANVSSDFTHGLLVNSLNLKSKFVNTDTFLMYKDFSLKAIPLTLTEGKFYTEKLNTSVYNTPVYMTAFSADFSIKDKMLNIKNSLADIYNGKLSAKINYNLYNEDINSEIMVRNSSAMPIFNLLTQRKDTINGTLDFDSKLTGNLSSKDTLKGNIKFIIHNGRMSTLGRIEHLLYAQNVVADNMLRTSLSTVTKAISLKDTGLFKYIKGDLTLNNGIAKINSMQSQGPLMALYVTGDYNTLNDNAKLTILGRLSDEVMTGLGAFGEFSFNKLLIMLTGEDERSNVLYAELQKVPQLAVRNTKEFKSVINGNINKSSSVISFNWISCTKKSLKQKEVPMTNIQVPAFIDELPY